MLIDEGFFQRLLVQDDEEVQVLADGDQLASLKDVVSLDLQEGA